MNRTLTYGLVFLAASGTHGALAFAVSSSDSALAAGGASVFFLSGATGGIASHSAQGYLGVDVRDVPGDQLAALKLKESRGAEIIQVDHDAPAGKAGLREHDVVLQMNGQTVSGEDQIRRMLRATAPGATVTLLISRDGQQITVTTQVASRDQVERQALHLIVPEQQESPSSEPMESPPSDSPASSPAIRGKSFLGTVLMSPAYTGAMLESMSPQLAGFFGVPSGAGLLVSNIQPNSPAALAGMHAGDVVLRADDRTLASTGDWAKAIKNSHGHPLNIVILRDKKEQTLTLAPDSKKRSSLEAPGDDTGTMRLGLSWLTHS